MAAIRFPGVALIALVIAWGLGSGTPVAAQVPSTAPIARIFGTVFDSVGRRPLRGALVQLVSTHDATRGRTATADSGGAFAFDSVPSGRYLLGFVHAALDSLGFEAPVARVDVRTSGEVLAPLATNSARTLVVQNCGGAALKDSTGLFLGQVRESLSGATVAGATVLVQWREYTISKGKIEQEVPYVELKTNERGGFAICGVPVAATLMVRAATDSAASGYVDLEVPADGLLHRDIFVGKSSLQLLPAANDSSLSANDSSTADAATQVLRGTGTLRGLVLATNGRPIEGARLAVWRTGVQAMTAAEGSYAMSALPAGSHILDVRALGYIRGRMVVDIRSDGETTRDLVLEPVGVFLDTVKVQGKNTVLTTGMEGFQKRKRSHVGHFLDPKQIEALAPFYVADIFRNTPGVRILTSDFPKYRVMMRGRGRDGVCSPAIFIDGIQQVDTQGDLEVLVAIHDIRGIEVYTRGSFAPPEFQTSDPCGTIVLWTGGLRKRARPLSPPPPTR
jgi:hypothetical protein